MGGKVPIENLQVWPKNWIRDDESIDKKQLLLKKKSELKPAIN